MPHAARLAYRAFEVVAWPAAGWGGVECLLRASIGPRDGLAGAALLAACAGGTIVFCRLRLRRIEPRS